jgi:Uma2 family endonuclease
MAEAASKRLAYDEYLRLERESDTRYEFLDGLVWAMSGGTPRHSKAKVNALVALGNVLGDGPCQAYDSDLKIRVAETGLATYPDISVICGEIERHAEDKNAAVNPAVIVEVLSESTEAWDRGAKFEHLSHIPALRHYVLVSPGHPNVEVYTRKTEGRWELARYRAGERLALDAIGVAIDVDAIYRNLPDEPEASPTGRVEPERKP